MRIVACGLLSLAAACDAAVASDLTESQANDVIVVLEGSSVPASKHRTPGSEPPSYEVRVGSGDVSRALATMAAAGVPRPTEPGLREVFGEVGLVPTLTEERARYGAAIAGELAQSLESLDGVIDAHVHIAFPARSDVFLDARERARPRASVLVKRRHDTSALDPRSIADLVAGAVSDLRTEDVAIVQVSAPASARRASTDVVWIGPVAVTRATAPVLRMVLGILLSVCIALAAGILALRSRFRRVTTAAVDPTP
jgi:type III secretion protein J